MATTTKRRPSSSVSVQKQSIEQATAHLLQLPEKPKDAWSLREAIELLQDSITEALNRGYSHEEVATIISAKGVKISPSSLKSYLAATRKDKDGSSKKAAKPRGKRAAKATPTPAVSSAPAAAAPVEVTAPATPQKRGSRAKSDKAPTKTAAKTRTRSTTKASTTAKSTPAKAPRTPSSRTRKKKETT